MGFVRPPETIAYHIDEKLGRTAVEAARHKFSPEFINRLHKLVVFRPLRREQLEEVL
jgi:ATP-dependent Clp protease ATP-binding subunit ClpB